MKLHGVVLGSTLTLTAALVGCGGAGETSGGTTSGAGGGSATTTSSQTSTGTGTMDQPNNKELVLAALDAIFINKDVSAVDKYFGDPYVNHNPTVQSGLPAFKELVKGVASNPNLKYERARAFADGDLVATHSRYTGLAAQPLIGFDIFRVDGNHKIVEHWDCLQNEPTKPNPSGHTMLDGTTAITDLDKTDANRAFVSDFLDTILVKGQGDKTGNYFAGTGDNYIQHNPQVGDGLAAFGAFLKQLADMGVALKYTKVHRVVAEGNFVLSQSEGYFGTQHDAFYDLIRVENGKIAEHWDVIQEVPDKTVSGLSMF